MIGMPTFRGLNLDAALQAVSLVAVGGVLSSLV